MKSNSFKEYREIILNYLGNACDICGSVENLHIHHILPKHYGGQNVMSNLQVLCSECHYKMHLQLDKILGGDELDGFICKECGKSFVSNKRGRNGECKCIKCKVKGISKNAENLTQVRLRKASIDMFLQNNPELMIMFDD